MKDLSNALLKSLLTHVCVCERHIPLIWEPKYSSKRENVFFARILPSKFWWLPRLYRLPMAVAFRH